MIISAPRAIMEFALFDAFRMWEQRGKRLVNSNLGSTVDAPIQGDNH